MHLSKLEVIFIGAFLSLAVLLFGSWLLKWHMEDRIIFSAIGFCLVCVLLIILNSIVRTRLASQKESVAEQPKKEPTGEKPLEVNDPQSFPRLVPEAIEALAARWVKMFSDIPITAIKLYPKQPQYDFGINSIYATVFEIDQEFQLLTKTNQGLKDKYDEWRHNMGFLSQAKDIEEFDVMGINADFSNVYKDKPHEDFMKDWYFISRAIDNIDDEASVLNMKVMMEEPHWVLYKKSTHRDREEPHSSQLPHHAAYVVT